MSARKVEGAEVGANAWALGSWNMPAIEDLRGEKIECVDGLEKGSENVLIHLASGKTLSIRHQHDCCETVDLEDFEVDRSLIGAEIVNLEACSNERAAPEPKYTDSWTWTFVRLHTTAGELWMRWLGESNGYYSEEPFIDVL